MAYTFKHGDRPLDDYTIQRAVGSGGFGEVYYAISDGGREVALKFLRDNPQVELRGVSHCINLKSPHLISIFDVKKDSRDQYFLIMEYCSGPSLRDLLIAEPNGFGAQKAAFFVREIAKGLAYLHDRGIVHRDLKPGNIFYDDGYVKIGDYGLSKFISVSRHSVQTSSVGTVHYMAPEIGSGNYSRGVDIYALGVMLYEMLLGRVPFEGSTMGEVLMKHLTAQPAVDELPQPFATVIRRALQKDPRDRYQSVNEMVDDLLAVESVQKSLDGFSLKSLDGAIYRGAAEQTTPVSPRPSPNPNIAYPRPFGPPPPPLPPPPYRPGESYERGSPYPLPDRLAKRLDTISRKIERKMNKLGGQRRRSDRNWQANLKGRWRDRREAAMAPWRSPGPVVEGQGHGHGRRLLLALLLTLGLAIGVGILVGNVSEKEEFGASAGMLVVGLLGGILLARKAIGWFGVDNGPAWSQYLVRFLCATPLAALASAPALDREPKEGLGLFLGLVTVAALTRWEREFDLGAVGELRIGPAIRAVFVALFAAGAFTAVLDGNPEDNVVIAAAVAAAVSLSLQATGWWLFGATSATPATAAEGVLPSEIPSPTGAALSTPPSPVPGGSSEKIATVLAPIAGSGRGRREDLGPRPRWAFTRAFWGVVAFVFMGGAIVTFLIPLIVNDLSSADVVQSVITCIAFACALLFALRKTTVYKRDGFWRETLRPLLISLSLFGVGATITGIAGGGQASGETTHEHYRDWDYSMTSVHEEESEIAPRAPVPLEDCSDAKGVALIDLPAIRVGVERARIESQRINRLLANVAQGSGSDRFLSEEALAFCITGLVLSSLIFLLLVLLTGRKRRPAPPFLQPAAGDPANAAFESSPHEGREEVAGPAPSLGS